MNLPAIGSASLDFDFWSTDATLAKQKKVSWNHASIIMATKKTDWGQNLRFDGFININLGELKEAPTTEAGGRYHTRWGP